MDDATLIRRFEAAELTVEEWHHLEHVRLAYLYLRALPFPAALNRLRTGLKALNAAHRVPENLDRGYHETLTQGWLRVVQCTLEEYGPAETSQAFLDSHSHLSNRRALHFYYSRTHLRSVEAKITFVEPDLAPLPRSRGASSSSINSSP